MKSLLTGLTCGIVLLSGCTHVLPEEARQRIDPGVDFAAVRQAPQEHVGKTLLLGGAVVALELSRDGSTLEVFRWRLDRWGHPVDVDETGGRFLVVTERLLDPFLYTTGRLVTLIATVIGEETRSLGPRDYTYPVFSLEIIEAEEPPFLYGRHPHPNLFAPSYYPAVAPWPDPYGYNPYDYGYRRGDYPYTPYWIRPGEVD